MNAFKKSISKIIRSTGQSFKTFPITISCALAFSIVTMVRIQLDWPSQEAYNFLFNCLHWSFALGAILSLAATTAAQSRSNQPKALKLANLISIIAVVVTFLALYLSGIKDIDLTTSRFATVAVINGFRVTVAIFVSFLVFIVLSGYPKDQSDIAKSFFMTQKAFFIAAIYGLVITGGASGVAGAIQALLYRDMSSKVYMYISTIAGFLAFTIFVGYFPDFRKGQTDEHREVAQKQPRFVEILFSYIMIPIVMALTVVLLIWAGRTVVTGTWPEFIRLSSIAAAYTISGVWLHVMVTDHDFGLSKYYKKVYPIAALIILLFEAWALLIQLGNSGLKITEYSFILIWIVAAVSSVMLIVSKAKAHRTIVAITCAIAIFAALPIVGYHDLPVTAQVNRLENMLVSEGILIENELVPTTTEPELRIKESITDAVNYLAYAEDAKLPDWFEKRLGEREVFKTKFGFEQTWPDKTFDDRYGDYMGISLRLPTEPINIMEYSWVVNMEEIYRQGETAVTIDGENGTYEIYWNVSSPNDIPSLKIVMDDRIIIEQDMNDYIDKILEDFPLGQAKETKATFKDMSLKLETSEVAVLLVFKNIEINVNVRDDIINYWINLDALYINEKPE